MIPRRPLLVPLALAVLCLVSIADGFRYHLVDKLNGTLVSFSEQFMYGTDQGPLGFKHGLSYIAMDMNMTAAAPAAKGNYITNVLFYKNAEYEIDLPPVDLCQQPKPVYPEGFSHTQLDHFPMARNDAGNTVTGQVAAKYRVEEGGLTYAVMQVCPPRWSAVAVDATFKGDITFHNTYGYLPGSDYGYLPFEALRGSAFVLLALAFGALAWHHRDTALPLHWVTLAVLSVAIVESFAWLGAYSHANRTGQPYCCPYPGAMVFAMGMQVLLRTSVRLLLLTVCLGYGIVRPDLERKEKMAICLLTVAFFVTGIMDITTQARLSTKFGDEATIQALDVWALPAFVTDLIFLTWIYSALLTMMERLKEHQESYKLGMYEKLARCISVFVSMFMLLLIGVLGIQAQDYNWLWQWLWLFDVIFEVLNFTVLTAVCVIWRPTRSSGLLSYSKQLATSEEAADAEADEYEEGRRNAHAGGDGADGANGLEMSARSTGGAAAVAGGDAVSSHQHHPSFTILGDRGADDSDSEGEEGDFSFNQNRPALNPFSAGFAAGRGNGGGGGGSAVELAQQRDVPRDVV